MIEYLDYRSADGYFRKYRFIFIGDEILPYHLAIGLDWKLHHDSTDMIEHGWMQREEEAFLSDPTTFSPGHPPRRCMRSRQAVDLGYFGIDCGLDRSGNLVVFEVNASMLIHQPQRSISYKAPYVERIKLAFDAILAETGEALKTPAEFAAAFSAVPGLAFRALPLGNDGRRGRRNTCPVIREEVCSCDVKQFQSP